MSSSTWRRARSCNARRCQGKLWPSATRGARNEYVQRNPSDIAERPAHGVALQGRHKLHAVLLAAGGGDLQLRLQSHGRGVTTHRRRIDLGGVLVRGSSRAESDLGTRTAQPGAGRIPGIAGSASCAVSGEGAGELPVRGDSGSLDGTAIRGVLPTAFGWAGLATRGGCLAGDMGAGGQWNVLCGDVDPHS